MPRWLVIVLAVVGLATAAVVERLTSGQQTGDVRGAAAKLEAVPAAFGDWTSTEIVLDEKVLRVAEATGNVSRLYTNRKNGGRVNVLLLCGPTGPIRAHTPEVCYAGSGYTMSDEPRKRTVVFPNHATATYWSARFEKKPPSTDSPIRVAWMWGVDGDWQASSSPRTDFALRSALYKLYVQRAEPLAMPPAGTAPDSTDEFLTAFLPEVKKALAAVK